MAIVWVWSRTIHRANSGLSVCRRLVFQRPPPVSSRPHGRVVGAIGSADGAGIVNEAFVVDPGELARLSSQGNQFGSRRSPIGNGAQVKGGCGRNDFRRTR